MGSQPIACDASTTVNAPCAAAAARCRRDRQPCRPTDCTALKATTSVSPSIASASPRAAPTGPRAAPCTRSGHVRDGSRLLARARERRRDARGDQPDEVRDARARRHTLGGHADERGEELARAVRRVAPVLPARPAVPPVGECLLERVPGRRGREAEGRRVEVRPGRLPQAGRASIVEHASQSNQRLTPPTPRT